MVLTDGEFGRAYLVEGWARRFLVELFRACSVLFVGYSHSDPIMHYLSRSLPGRQSMTRFALVRNDEIEMSRWRRLGIVPIPYPKHPGDDHVALNEGVRALADYATRGLIVWRSEITKLAENAPPVDEEAASIKIRRGLVFLYARLPIPNGSSGLAREITSNLSLEAGSYLSRTLSWRNGLPSRSLANIQRNYFSSSLDTTPSCIRNSGLG